MNKEYVNLAKLRKKQWRSIRKNLKNNVQIYVVLNGSVYKGKGIYLKEYSNYMRVTLNNWNNKRNYKMLVDIACCYNSELSALKNLVLWQNKHIEEYQKTINKIKLELY